MGRMEGKVAVITGGASGIGEASVRLFCAEGARCVIADIQHEQGEALASELGEAAVYQRTDVSREEDVQAVVKRAVSEFGRLDCMFNNAGFMGTTGPIADIPLDEFDMTLSVLLRGPFLGIKHAAPVMKAQGSGSIINTASIAGAMAGIGPHVYAAAKAAVMQLSKSVSLELAGQNIRVNAICPGVILTPLATASMTSPEMSSEQATEVAREVMKMYQPIRRAGVAQDIAYCALWLAGEESSFVTGQSFLVDGGATAGLEWSQQPDFIKVHTPMRRQ
jgi:NAD(P)-dependent dehydrogenase (short-subunit alcohol dehydrogenase family)